MSVSIREAHRWASSFLQRHSQMTADEAHFTAEYVLRHLLGWDRSRFFAYAGETLPEEQWIKLQQLIEKRSEGVPLQHLIGRQEFYGRPFHVSPDVLIPRPETEVLVETVLREAETLWGEQPCRVIDVGTGSGAIAVTLAAERPSWDVTAVDLSAAALALARKNATRHGAASHIQFIQGDLLQPFIDSKDMERFDIVVANPPYIPSRDIETLAIEVKGHEPLLALDGGRDGLHVYRRLATMLPHVMKQEKGLVAVEVGAGQSRQVATILRNVFPQGEAAIVPDLARIERVVSLKWP